MRLFLARARRELGCWADWVNLSHTFGNVNGASQSKRAQNSSRGGASLNRRSDTVRFLGSRAEPGGASLEGKPI